MYLCVRGIVTKPGKLLVMYLCVRGIVTKPGKRLVMYLCVRGIVTKHIPSQESDWSFGNDTPNPQIHDQSLSWLGTGLATIPLTHRYMTNHFPGLVQAW
jgi:hypothetical protein